MSFLSNPPRMILGFLYGMAFTFFYTSTIVVPFFDRFDSVTVKDSHEQHASDTFGEDIARVLQTTIRYRFPRAKLQKPMDILFGIMSTPPMGRLRNAIRDTWGRNHSLLFLIGGNWTDELKEEFLQHQDILWLDRLETYEGLPYKTFCFLDAARKHVTDFQYIYKTDDDVYVNVDLLNKLIRDFQHPNYLGKTLHMEIIRDPTRKWYTPEEEYPNATHFHPFNIGAGYAISSKVLKNNSCVAKEIQKQSFLALEDVSVGWVMHKCQISEIYYDGWDFWDNPWLFEFPRTWEEFERNFNPENRKYKEVINLYEIKHTEVMHRHHVEYCLTHSLTSINCQGVDITCAQTKQRSSSCSFVSCGANMMATNCESCPSPLGDVSIVHEERCGGDCQWCRFGTIGDGHDEGLKPGNIEAFQLERNRCVPKNGPRCRT